MSEHANTIREIINKENELLNHRVTWLSTLQGLLFAAFAFSYGKDMLITNTICCLGITVAIVSFFAINASTLAVYRQYDWWHKNKPENYKGPEVIGHPPFIDHKFFRNVTPWIVIPIAFLISWCVILFK